MDIISYTRENYIYFIYFALFIILWYIFYSLDSALSIIIFFLLLNLKGEQKRLQHPIPASGLPSQ